MTDSSSFSSLLALVDSHLSRTSIHPENATSLPLVAPPSLPKPGTLSNTRLALPPGQRLPIPFFDISNSPIQTVLAEQVANMLKAKELKHQLEEKRRLEEKKKQELHENYCGIDLMATLQIPSKPALTQQPSEPAPTQQLNVSSNIWFIDFHGLNEELKAPEPNLPCTTDMTYILYQHVRSGKCSTFGKVLTSRVRPVAAPYLEQKFQSVIIPFDFSTPSPCDVLKDKQMRKVTCSQQYQPDIFNFNFS